MSLSDLFDRMSTQELEDYAQSGTLPKWFEAVAQVGETSEKLVFRPLAENTDRLEWLNERFGLLPAAETLLPA